MSFTFRYFAKCKNERFLWMMFGHFFFLLSSEQLIADKKNDQFNFYANG